MTRPRVTLSPHFWMAIFAEAMSHFGPPSGWDQPEVAWWMKERVRGLISGQETLPDLAPYEPKSMNEPPREDW